MIGTKIPPESRILKYPLSWALQPQAIALPIGSLIQSALIQNGRLVVYAIVPDEYLATEDRYFQLVWTGRFMVETPKTFLGSFICEKHLVWHLYEVGEV